MNRVKLLSTYIDALSMEETIDKVDEYILSKKPLHLMGVNADKINQMAKNDELKRIVNESKIINADGASVVLASRFLNHNIPERVAGVDLMISLVKLAEEKGYPVYLVGAKQEVIEKTIEVLKKEHPSLKIRGYRNGYFDKNQWNSVGQEIKKSKASIVFVGITSPLKEYLVDYWLRLGINTVFMGVGGSFDVISGNIKRAPLWLQKIHLEWFFRMLNEPKRLFKRYFIGNSKFIITVVKEKIKS